MSAADTLLEISRDRLKDQSDTLRLITTKNNFMLGMAILIAVREIPQDAPKHILDSILLMYLSIVLCVFCSFSIMLSRSRYAEGVILKDAAKVLRDYDDLDEAKKWIAEANLIACEYNAKYLKRIEFRLRLGLVCLALGLLYFALAREAIFNHLLTILLGI